MKIVYFDIHVIYNKTTFNKIIEKMKSFNYSGLYVSLEEKDLKFKNDISELCKDNLLEFKSRYDLDFEDYRKNKSIKELKKNFNYISLKNVNWSKINPVNLRSISILEMDIIPNILIRKMSKSAKHIIFEFNLSKFNKILETNPDATDLEVKKAYRKMAAKFHPDKVHHLGEEFQKMAEEKFKSVNDAYQQIKKERGMK